ncbi:MAG: hypothetical protein KKH68_06155 [Proteobacteria bacterium]|nr:hypothetical protein [Pseudomonadota bacterium]
MSTFSDLEKISQKYSDSAEEFIRAGVIINLKEKQRLLQIERIEILSRYQATTVKELNQKWSNVSTFPKHCHDGTQLNVTESFLPDDYEKAIETFLRLVRKKMAAEQLPEKKQR